MFDLLGDWFVHGDQSNHHCRFAAVTNGGDKVACVMRVWIDQDLCTGDGLCVDHCPDVFVQLEDGIAYVAEAEFVLNDPGGGGSLARVEPRNEQAVIHAALACPGECIFIDVQHVRAADLTCRPTVARIHVRTGVVGTARRIVTMGVGEIPPQLSLERSQR